LPIVKSSRLTYHGALVLSALARGYRYGFEIMDFTSLPSGTAYPILRRFELQKLVRSRWEGEKAARRDGRPRRRYYELTEEGRKLLSAALARFSDHRRVFDDALGEPESSR
jgi:DNA-binding PadR family transcriptional regulator